MAKMSGTFCESTKAPASSFDQRSFRWKKSGKSWILVGCPQGKWKARKKGKKKCAVGLRAHKVLARAHGACRVGKRISK